MKQLLNSIGALQLFLFLADAANAQKTDSFYLVGMPSQKVPVGWNKMTNLVFPVNIRAGSKVSREVLVQKVKGVENVLELKAMKRHFAPTNLSVYGQDGRLYSFDLQYADTPLVLNFRVMKEGAGWPVNPTVLEKDATELAGQKGFLHISGKKQKMILTIQGIYLKDSLLWLVLNLQNHSLIPYHPEYLNIYVKDRKRAKRKAMQQVTVKSVYSGIPETIAGRCAKSFALGMPAFTIARDKKLLVEMAEHNGGRVLILTISNNTVLKARAVK